MIESFVPSASARKAEASFLLSDDHVMCGSVTLYEISLSPDVVRNSADISESVALSVLRDLIFRVNVPPEVETYEISDAEMISPVSSS